MKRRKPLPDPYGYTVCNICGGGAEHNSACPFGPDPVDVMRQLDARPAPAPRQRPVLPAADAEWLDQFLDRLEADA